MLTLKQISEITDGTALLDVMGWLFEYVGVKGGKYVFKGTDGTGRITASLEQLLSTAEYKVSY